MAECPKLGHTTLYAIVSKNEVWFMIRVDEHWRGHYLWLGRSYNTCGALITHGGGGQGVGFYTVYRLYLYTGVL